MKNPPSALSLYPLANPKGEEHGCEVCSKPACLQCGVCRITYYCGIEHQKIDWVGIHKKICLDLITFRESKGFVSKDKRQKKSEELQNKNLDLVRLTHLESRKLLFKGKSEKALPAALQCLRFAVRAYGIACVELVSPYLVLAESCIGLGKLNQAETYLAQAQWIVLKAQHGCTDSIQSQLHRKLGLLYAAKGNYELALASLAKDIFYASLEYGTEHICTAGGYFHMAEVFYAMYKANGNIGSLDQNFPEKSTEFVYPSVTPEISEINKQNKSHGSLIYERKTKPNNSLSTNSEFCIQPPSSKAQVVENLYTRVVNIWARYLRELVESLLFKPVFSEDVGAIMVETNQKAKQTLDDAQKAEAEKMLYAIEKYHNQRISENELNASTCNPAKPDPKVQLYLTLSMLNYILERKQESIQYLIKAKVAAEFMVQHPKITVNIKLMERAFSDKIIQQVA
ncbi:Zinc finger MYND domain-containing protein 12 [Schistosoma haematobium]|uniref:Zinc finger MYND domain-containing protein 12 n=1 Tax=Schistosoma haematobium TaxID=6185 RepID=A0A6A5DV01_SCHHA|nr:Zinc finger MYND domain-containing protein 12 [Schistosoma haematobium]KAH9591854.1 Zinc finger MYND domain-containing protein 12 [Schistosoma haematobium]CAH8673784.1 unnamed protein product [Schistosoma haematobium]